MAHAEIEQSPPGGRRVLARRRRELIAAHVQQHGSVRVSELTTELGVSDMTIRRDLEALTQQGMLTKVHGGATLTGVLPATILEPGFLAKSSEQTAEKEAIASAAAALVRPGTAIGLTAGTTTWHLATRLVDVADLVVITNSIRIFETLLAHDRPHRNVMLIGGIRTPSDALVGPLAVQALASLHLDQAFLGVHGMTERTGFTTPNLLEADTNRAFVEAAQRLVVVADHSKWDTIGLASIAPLGAADTLVTDDGLDPAAIERLRTHVDDVVVCPLELGVESPEIVTVGAQIARWVGDPAATGLGRMPMAPRSAPYDDIGEAVAGAPSKWMRSLDGPWQFLLRSSPADVDADDVATETSIDGWDEVAVPSSWVLPADGDHGRGAPIYLNVRMPFTGQAPHVPADNPTGVYRREFSVPAAWHRRRALLRVGAANSMGFVWINGEFVGFGTDSHLPSTYDITDQLRRGTNTVCIIVPRWSAATWVEDQDQWWMPGLHRSVELVSVPTVALGDTATVPGLEADDTTGTLDLDVGVEAGRAEPDPLTVEVVVSDPLSRRRRPVATTGRVDVPRWAPRHAGDEHTIAYTWPGHRVIERLRVPGVETWNHENPRRYRVAIILRDGDGTVLDVRARWVGFRRITLADRAVLVNGVPVVINGVNHHDINPDRGPATTVDDTRRDLELMKRHHVNAVRTSHYPKDESFYDLCDELGLYVIDEADIETHARWRATSDDPAYAAAFLERGMRMVLRDRSHPCVIAWSLGNESGYGPSHDVMAAWIRRVDPSRVLHYEGGFSRDLDAASPVPDIVCPMYAPVERIVRWSVDGRDRRPLILCEYNHAMGQAGGLADYWAVFGIVEGLQGGFVWEWADHGLRRREADGAEWIVFGGDFGEVEHDGNFVCDGLVSADREPHPLLAELATLTQPVAVEAVGGNRLRVTNRRWFTDLGDLDTRWEVYVAGRRAARGRLDVPAISPQSSADVPMPNPALRDAVGPGLATLVVRFTPRHRAAWAPRDWVASTTSIDLGRRDDVRRPSRRRRRSLDVEVTDDGVVAGEVVVGWPALSLWRAPTDNDDPPGEWRATTPAARWRADGLDRIVETASETRRRGGAMTRVVGYKTATGQPIEHRQRIEIVDGEALISEVINVDRSLGDLPRVGVAFELPVEFDRLAWLGLGPGDSYPDRRAAVRFGRWESAVSDLVVPFVRPQEYGMHLDTEWFELASPSFVLRVAGEQPLAFSALPDSVEELEAATHAHLLPLPTATHVQVDVAHRGLGTAACGPDTHPRHLVKGGTHRFTWTVGLTSRS